MEDVEEGVRVGEELLKDVKFAIDQGMLEHTDFADWYLINSLIKSLVC